MPKGETSLPDVGALYMPTPEQIAADKRKIREANLKRMLASPSAHYRQTPPAIINNVAHPSSHRKGMHFSN